MHLHFCLLRKLWAVVCFKGGWCSEANTMQDWFSLLRLWGFVGFSPFNPLIPPPTQCTPLPLSLVTSTHASITVMTHSPRHVHTPSDLVPQSSFHTHISYIQNELKKTHLTHSPNQPPSLHTTYTTHLLSKLPTTHTTIPSGQGPYQIILWQVSSAMFVLYK